MVNYNLFLLYVQTLGFSLLINCYPLQVKNKTNINNYSEILKYLGSVTTKKVHRDLKDKTYKQKREYVYEYTPTPYNYAGVLYAQSPHYIQQSYENGNINYDAKAAHLLPSADHSQVENSYVPQVVPPSNEKNIYSQSDASLQEHENKYINYDQKPPSSNEEIQKENLMSPQVASYNNEGNIYAQTQYSAPHHDTGNLYLNYEKYYSEPPKEVQKDNKYDIYGQPDQNHNFQNEPFQRENIYEAQPYSQERYGQQQPSGSLYENENKQIQDVESPAYIPQTQLQIQNENYNAHPAVSLSYSYENIYGVPQSYASLQHLESTSISYGENFSPMPPSYVAEGYERNYVPQSQAEIAYNLQQYLTPPPESEGRYILPQNEQPSFVWSVQPTLREQEYAYQTYPPFNRPVEPQYITNLYQEHYMQPSYPPYIQSNEGQAYGGQHQVNEYAQNYAQFAETISKQYEPQSFSTFNQPMQQAQEIQNNGYMYLTPAYPLSNQPDQNKYILTYEHDQNVYPSYSQTIKPLPVQLPEQHYYQTYFYPEFSQTNSIQTLPYLKEKIVSLHEPKPTTPQSFKDTSYGHNNFREGTKTIMQTLLTKTPTQHNPIIDYDDNDEYGTENYDYEPENYESDYDPENYESDYENKENHFTTHKLPKSSQSSQVQSLSLNNFENKQQLQTERKTNFDQKSKYLPSEMKSSNQFDFKQKQPVNEQFHPSLKENSGNQIKNNFKLPFKSHETSPKFKKLPTTKECKSHKVIDATNSKFQSNKKYSEKNPLLVNHIKNSNSDSKNKNLNIAKDSQKSDSHKDKVDYDENNDYELEKNYENESEKNDDYGSYDDNYELKSKEDDDSEYDDDENQKREIVNDEAYKKHTNENRFNKIPLIIKTLTSKQSQSPNRSKL